MATIAVVVVALDAWKSVRRELTKGRRPKVVRLTDTMAKTIPANQDEETLDELIEEQKRDSEPSPLDDSGRAPRSYPAL